MCYSGIKYLNMSDEINVIIQCTISKVFLKSLKAKKIV